MYSFDQFQQHMTNIRRYAYLQGQNTRLAWLAEKYAEKNFTEALEREFVTDIDNHLEELACSMENSDFMAVMNYWMDLSKKYWNVDQRRAFVKKVEKICSDYSRRSSQDDSLATRFSSIQNACDKILKTYSVPPVKSNSSGGVFIFVLLIAGALFWFWKKGFDINALPFLSNTIHNSQHSFYEKQLIGNWIADASAVNRNRSGDDDWPRPAVLSGASSEKPGDMELSLESNGNFRLVSYPISRKVEMERDSRGRSVRVHTIRWEVRGRWQTVGDGTIKIEYTAASSGVFFPGGKKSGGGPVSVNGNTLTGWMGMTMRKLSAK